MNADLEYLNHEVICININAMLRLQAQIPYFFHLQIVSRQHKDKTNTWYAIYFIFFVCMDAEINCRLCDLTSDCLVTSQAWDYWSHFCVTAAYVVTIAAHADMLVKTGHRKSDLITCLRDMDWPAVCTYSQRVSDSLFKYYT